MVNQGMKSAADAVRSLLLRMLATSPPGKMRFTFIDPVGLGQNVAAFMPLGKENDALIHSRAWTEPHHIEQRLAELTEHMENVIQKYLQAQYANIQEYNSKAGEIAEPFRVLVVFDFPASFSDSAIRRLLSIIRHGPRCGVYTVIQADHSKPLPYSMQWKDLEQSSLMINVSSTGAIWNEDVLRNCRLVLDQPPANELFSRIIATAGETAKSAMKVEVPFSRLLTKAAMSRDAWWKGCTANGIQVPLGPTGARDVQYLAFGEGSTHHALVVGRTGSGKTNLMHVAITSLALKYSPVEIQLYLVDFKGGVGFKVYAEHRLPHAMAIAIESDREFGMSLLDKIDTEMRERSELFRANGVPDLASYRGKTGKPLPRIFLLVDEFQEFFTEDDELAQRAKQLFERLVRQGRGFGIHIMLGTQSLSGSASLPESTLGQIAVRIALQCSEADGAAILASDNKEARLLSRPGEAIYNSAAGLIEGNSRFQVALLPDDMLRSHLHAVEEMVDGHGHSVPIVFEGNASVNLSECQPLSAMVGAAEWPAESRVESLWLGEPVSLRPAVKANLTHQSGRHLLAVMRDEAEGMGVLTAAWMSLLAQNRPTTARFYVLNYATSDAPWADLAAGIVEWFPHQIELLTRRGLVPCLNEWVGRIKSYHEQDHGQKRITDARVYLLVLGLHRARDLKEDETRYYASDAQTQQTAAELFATVLRDGPEAGIHVLAWSDTYANAARIVGRSMSEFGIRVAGPMSADDSRSFVDETVAARLDKPHRAFLADEERPGSLDKFRPYAIPEKAWLSEIGARLGSR